MNRVIEWLCVGPILLIFALGMAAGVLIMVLFILTGHIVREKKPHVEIIKP